MNKELPPGWCEKNAPANDNQRCFRFTEEERQKSRSRGGRKAAITRALNKLWATEEEDL